MWKKIKSYSNECDYGRTQDFDDLFSCQNMATTCTEQEMTFLWQMTRRHVLNTGKKQFIGLIGTPGHRRRNTTMGKVSRLMSVKWSGAL